MNKEKVIHENESKFSNLDGGAPWLNKNLRI